MTWAFKLRSRPALSSAARLARVQHRPCIPTATHVALAAVVIGGTSILGNDLYLLHSVTLGATGKPTGGAKRHPTIGDRVVIGGVQPAHGVYPARINSNCVHQ